MRRALLLVVALTGLLAATGCATHVLQRQAYREVKRTALVQYAVRPNGSLGTLGVEEVRQRIAQTNVQTFMKEMKGPFQLVPLEQVTSNSYYATSKPTEAAYYTSPGMRFFSDDLAISRAQLTPELSRKLCEALKVDAVIAVTENWSTSLLGPLFILSKATVTYTFNMYSASGTRIWGDVIRRELDLFSPGGIVAKSHQATIEESQRTLSDAISEATLRIERAPDGGDFRAAHETAQ